MNRRLFPTVHLDGFMFVEANLQSTATEGILLHNKKVLNYFSDQ